MDDIRVKLKNAEGEILLPASLSDILAHGYGENANFSETTVKAELDKLLKLMTSSGTSLDDAIKALQELNEKSESTHYSSLVDLATFIENFMIDEGVVLDVIDTWEELEKFLQGITDTDTLTGLLQESYNRLTAEKSAVAVGDDEKFITVTKTDEPTTYTNEKGEETATTYPLYTITTSDIASATALANLESTVAGISSDLSDYAKASDLEEVKETAEAAVAAAEAAQATADSAVTAAADALAAADKAQETADTKQDKLTAGENITISEDNVISALVPDLEGLKEAVEAAQTTANQAETAAKAAQSAAEGAQSTADDAVAAAATAERDAQTALSTAETAQTTAEAAQSDVDDLKGTVESLGGTYLTKTDAESIYATKDALSEVSSTLDTVNNVANDAASQANINAQAIEQLQATVVTGVYYELITNE